MNDRPTDLLGAPIERTLQNTRFDDWLALLDAEYQNRGGDETGRPLVEQTGRECWLEYYADGYSPKDALDEDWSHQ